MLHLESLIRPFYEVPGRVISLRQGEYLFYEGDTANYFYFVRAGQISITKGVSSGRVLSLRLAAKGSVIGELPLFQEKPSYLFNAMARTDSEVYAIDMATLERYLEKKPKLALNLLRILGAHARKQHSKFRDLVLYGKKGALYSTLIRLANSYGVEEDGGILIPITFTNQDLANYSATARESLNRMLSELKKDGVIETRGHYIFIRDIDYLRGEIHCENCGREICNIE